MIVFITKSPWNFQDARIHITSDVLSSLKFLRGLMAKGELIGSDCETEGLNVRSGKLLLWQLGNETHQVVIDCSTINIHLFKEVLEYDNCIYHSGQFDFQRLFKLGIHPTHAHDTFLRELQLNNYTNVFKKVPENYFRWDSLVQRYTGHKITKDVRKQFVKGVAGIDLVSVLYAAADVQHSVPVWRKQEELLKSWNMEKVFSEVENDFLPVCAYAEYCGIHLDKERWAQKMDEDKQQWREAVGKLKKMIGEKYPQFHKSHGTLFDKEPPVSFNVNSPKDVLQLLKLMGVDTKVKDKKTKKMKDSTGDKVLQRHKHIPIIQKIIECRAIKKNISTYGANFINAVDPVTDRIHANFKQLGALVSGRMSSGGGEYKINLQNIPKKDGGRHRRCFIPQPGKDTIFIVADYSQQEKVVLANKSKDPGLIEVFLEGDGDLHCYATRHMNPELAHLDTATIKKEHGVKRDHAKKVGFAIDYGGNVSTLVDQGYEKHLAEKMFEDYFKAFPTLKPHFNKCFEHTMETGYVLISDVTGRKHFMPEIQKMHQMNSWLTPKFWKYYRAHKYANTKEFKEKLKPRMSWYRSLESTLRKASQNYPIQGTAAEITKKGAAAFYKYLVKNDLVGIVWIVNIVHDEIVVELPKYLAESIAPVLQKCMEEAATEYCPIVPLHADPEISMEWTH